MHSRPDYYLNSFAEASIAGKHSRQAQQAKHVKQHLDSMDGASSHSALPVALVSKDLDQANDDAIDVAVEALKAEGSQVAACLVACYGLIGPHCYQPLMHLHHHNHWQAFPCQGAVLPYIV